MLTDPKSTLAYWNSRPLTTPRDMSETPCVHFAQAFAHTLDTFGLKEPEPQALVFYGLNHCAAMIKNSFAPLEPLPPSHAGLLDYYHTVAGQSALRAFHYLVAICIRESRHAHKHTVLSKQDEIIAAFGHEVFQFEMNTIDSGEQHGVTYFKASPPKCSIGRFLSFLEWQFTRLGYSGAFGGKPWANIAATAGRFIHGTISAEVMLDTVWTLAHNTGPIFNKGMLYNTQNTSKLQRILDVQRAGLIPTAMLFDTGANAYAGALHIGHPDEGYETAHERITGFMHQYYPEELGTYVDWFLVEALGAVGKYGDDKKKQVAKHGVSKNAAKIDAAIAAAEAKAFAAAEAAKTALDKSFFAVMPGLSVKKYVRAA